jgi:hypothetical protein
MDVGNLQDFFFWCMVINAVVYTVTAIAVIVLKDFVYSMQRKLLGVDDEMIAAATYRYLSTYKLLITVFNFTPWVALLIIN